jgi:hypothetical protein
MARIHPDGWRELQATGAAAREIETLHSLANGLSDAYSVYHGVHWSRVEQGDALFGEIDFAIVNPAGQILLIEQKSGFLDETPKGLVKRYGQTEKHVAVQLARSRDALLARLTRSADNAKVHLDALLYCPDYHVKAPGSAGIDPSRIIDAGRRDLLVEVIRTLLPETAPPSALNERAQRFLADELRLVPDVSAVIGQSRVLYTRLSGGLAWWARQIDCHPFRLRVTGTAGSGKTQLALNVLSDAIAAGRRPLYVCYNRPLADHIARIAPAGCRVATYHQLCDRLYRASGQTPDFSRPGAFQALETFMAHYQPDSEAVCDELIVDEGQDFQPDWKDNLLRLLKPDGRAWWLEDPMQNLYGRAPLDLPGWVGLHAEVNYRSPKDILERLNRLLGPDSAIRAGSPISGGAVDILTYHDAAGLMERTKTAITRGLGAGFRKEAIALITYRGREHSRFTPLDRLGPHSLKAYTGTYDLLGAPVYTAGDLFIDSVYRFKGQSAPCVIFTEIDFAELDANVLRKLFVGMTRATLKLILVITDASAQALKPLIDREP